MKSPIRRRRSFLGRRGSPPLAGRTRQRTDTPTDTRVFSRSGASAPPRRDDRLTRSRFCHALFTATLVVTPSLLPSPSFLSFLCKGIPMPSHLPLHSGTVEGKDTVVTNWTRSSIFFWSRLAPRWHGAASQGHLGSRGGSRSHGFALPHLGCGCDGMAPSPSGRQAEGRPRRSQDSAGLLMPKI